MNNKVKRLLSAIAVVMKDENPLLIKKIDDVINDRYQNSRNDGYPFNFKEACEGYKAMVKGNSW